MVGLCVVSEAKLVRTDDEENTGADDDDDEVNADGDGGTFVVRIVAVVVVGGGGGGGDSSPAGLWQNNVGSDHVKSLWHAIGLNDLPGINFKE